MTRGNMANSRGIVESLGLLRSNPKAFFHVPAVRQFVTFACVGVVGVTFNYGIFFLLYHYAHVHYLTASATGFIAAIIVAYTLNRKYTFKSKTSYKTHLVQYVAVNLFSLVLGLIVLALLVEKIGLNPYIANVLTLGVTTLTNFTGSKFLVFRA